MLILFSGAATSKVHCTGETGSTRPDPSPIQCPSVCPPAPGIDPLVSLHATTRSHYVGQWHHESWNFISLPVASYFAQAHLCLMHAELDHYQSKSEYRDYLEGCLDQIAPAPERDIQPFFVPADRHAASDRLLAAVEHADAIDIAAHRFTYGKLMWALKNVLDWHDTPVRLVADDDMYWAGHGDQVGEHGSRADGRQRRLPCNRPA